LKGKVVGLTQHGGTDELALRMLLRARGLAPDFVTLVLLGSQANNVAALLSGAQQNAVITRVEKGQLAHAGMLERGRMIVNFHDEIRLQTGGLVTTAKEISLHPDRVRRVLRAVWKGTLYLMHERAGVMEIVHRRDPGLSPETLAADVDGGIADVDEDGVMPMDAAAKELAARAELNGIDPAKIPPPEQVYDFAPLKEAIAEIAQSGWKPEP
jgi:ABC-type nitrate/sulfonate/bicarbonate transport system substrate-binding protein